MTSQESFKRRIRERMTKTGERYAAARKVLLDQATARQQGRSRQWVSEPETSDDAVREATGKSYDEWCDIIEAWGAAGGDPTDHPAVAAHLQSDLNLSGWWAQSITVGYERITGLRLPYQRADGTFAVSKTKTVAIDADVLRKMLLDDSHRADLFPRKSTELRSKPTTKALRIGIGPGVAVFDINDSGDDRSTVTVRHEKLPTYDNVEEWRFYWNDWLDAVAVTPVE
jgi:hypothetical protein